MAATEGTSNTELEEVNDDVNGELTGEDPAQEGEDEKAGGTCQFPLARIKRIMKADPDLHMCNQDAVFTIAKATELFIESLVLEVSQVVTQSRKKTVTKRDIDNCIDAIDALAFLDGAMD